MSPQGMDRVFFVTSGTSANETAMQIARQYQIQRGKPRRYKIIGQWHNYYGATLGSLSMSGNFATRRDMDMDPYLLDFPHIQAPFCYHCPYQLNYPTCQLACANDLARTIEQEGPDTIAAFIATPVIGTSGAIVPPPGYFEKIREICDRYEILLIADEVITGFGRLGTNFGMEHWHTIPDLITVGKTLGSGYAPIGAVIARQRIWDTLVQGNKNNIRLMCTYSGHPISCATALAVQNYLTEHQLIERCKLTGEYLKKALEKLSQRQPLIGDVRGEGLLLCIEFVQNRDTHQPFPRAQQVVEKVVQAAFKRGLILLSRFGTGTDKDGDHISISPPFIISEAECDELVAILEASIIEVTQTLKLTC
jgi:adenosylmethionine-8-amino-7-oxononanoate aminotransferase